MARKRIGEILVQAGILGEPELKAALVEQRRWGGQLGRILIDMKLVTEEALVLALSQQLNFPTANLDGVNIHDDVIDLVSGELAAQHCMMPFQRVGKFLDVAMSEPTNLGIIDELRIRTQLNVRPYLAGPKMIERAIERCYGPEVLEDVRAARQGVATGQSSGTTGPIVTLPPKAQQGQAQPSQEPRPPARDREGEIRALQARISQLEALVSRDEDVLRKVLGLLIEKGVATREEILERIR